MSEEEKKEEPVTKEGLSQADLDAMNKDIEQAKEKLVSKEVQSELDKAKADAKAEAEKEFMTNQRIKELEEEKKKLEEVTKQKEKEAAQKLEELNKKVNEMISSKAVIQNDNPFGEKKTAPGDVSDEVADQIEEASYKEFVSSRVRGMND